MQPTSISPTTKTKTCLRCGLAMDGESPMSSRHFDPDRCVTLLLAELARLQAENWQLLKSLKGE